MTYKQILVSDKVHKKVQKIAKSNYRGMGAQVEYWADTECPHPTEMREEKVVAVAPIEDGKVGEDNTLRIIFCNQCHRHILVGDEAEIARKLETLV